MAMSNSEAQGELGKKKCDVEDALRVDLGSLGTDAERKLMKSKLKHQDQEEENNRHSA